MPKLEAILQNMTQRERYAVMLAGMAIFLFLVIRLGISPWMDHMDTLKRQALQKTRDLEEMVTLKSRFEAMDRSSDLARMNFTGREAGFTLFSFLDKLSGETDIKDHITTMKPSSSESKTPGFRVSQVELKLKAVTLNQLTEYLYGIETSRNVVFVKRLVVDQSVQPEGYIDVTLQVETYEKEQGPKEGAS